MKTEEYEAHAAWTTLDALNEILEQDLRPESDDERYAVRRAQSMAELADELRDADPILAEAAALNDLNAHMTQVLNHLKTYLSDPDANRAHLLSAAGQVVNVVNSVRTQFPVTLPDEANRAAKAASTRYKNSLDAEVERLVGEIDSLKSQLTVEREQREADRTAAEEALEDLKEKITNSGTEVDGLTTKLNKQIDEQRTSFEDEAASRAALFKDSERAVRPPRKSALRRRAPQFERPVSNRRLTPRHFSIGWKPTGPRPPHWWTPRVATPSRATTALGHPIRPPLHSGGLS